MIGSLGVRAGDEAPRTTRARTAASVLALGLCAPLLAVLLSLVALAGSASAAPGSGTGGEGQTLAVSQIDGLSPDGTAVTVTGAGYNPLKGIYVAFCVTPAPGQLPTPCGGGAGGASGGSGLSGWVSSNPPSYGKDLVTPFGDGGTFSMQMTLSAMIGSVDCRTTSCAVVTRADHTRSDDRTADVVVPVTFGEAGPAPSAEPTPTPETTPAQTTPAETGPATTSPAATTPTESASPTTPGGTDTAAAPDPSVSTQTELISSRDDGGSSVAWIVIAGGVAAVLAIGGIGYLAMRRKAGPGTGTSSTGTSGTGGAE